MISPLRSRTLVVLAVAAALGVSIVGCAPDAPKPASSGSASTSAPAGPSDSPTPDASASAAPGITAQSIGGHALGGPLTSAAQDLGAKADTRCPWVFSARQAWTTWLTADADAAEPTDAIALIAIDSFGLDAHPAGAPTTASGIGLGSSVAQVKAAYPSAESVDAVNVDFALRYTEGDGSIVFEGRDDVVQSIKVLPANAANPSEYCG